MKPGVLSSLIFAFAAGLIAAALSLSPLGRRADEALLDTAFNLRGVLPPPSEIVIIGLDELSYSALKVPLNQPWPRALHAELLKRLAEYKVGQVIFDVLFLDAGPDPNADKALAEAIKLSPVYLGAESALQQIGSGGGVYAIEELLEPYTPFYESAKGVGLVSLPSSGSMVRKFLTERTERTREIASLAETGAGLAPGDGKPRPKRDDFINYFGPGRALRTISYYKVLETVKPLPKDALAGKTVFVGLTLRTETGPTQKDVFPTPFDGPPIFGVEIHATAAANLKSGSWITRSGKLFEGLLALLLTFAIAVLILRTNPIWGAVAAFSAIIVWSSGAYLLFLQNYLMPCTLVVWVFLPVLLLISSLYYYLVVHRSEKRLRSAFELYLSPQMAKELYEKRGPTALGGEKLWATALFTDINSFTDIAEDMPAEQVSDMLNSYFSELIEVVFEKQGTLIKFIGDAIFAIWGAPIKTPNHAALAVAAAVEIQKRSGHFTGGGRFPELRTRIGIHTGPMLVGNLGSERRVEYTAIGDSVNLASRVEGLNKYFGTWILLTEATRKDAGTAIKTTRIGAVCAAGKREVIDIHTIFEPELTPENLSHWMSAVDHFSQRRWGEASVAFEHSGKGDPRLQKAADFYLSKISEFAHRPPEPGWKGEIIFQTK